MIENSKKISLGYAIGRTNWYFRTLINKLLKEGGVNITNEQWLVLKVIAANQALSQTDIAEKSMKDKTNITRIIDLLEKHAYIERRKDHQDRRMYRIHITEQGRRVIEDVKPITQRIDEICIQAIDDKEIKALLTSLDAVCDSIRKEL